MKSQTLLLSLSIIFFASCTSMNKTMKEPNSRVEFTKNDFTLSDQVKAEAKCVKVFGIDFKRLFTNKTGALSSGSQQINSASIPVVGNFITDKTAGYSLYELMNTNPGYDVVFYPQYDTKRIKPVLGIGFLLKITTVKTTARLGKLK